jgi:uncharacterized protein (DUF1800 family)
VSQSSQWIATARVLRRAGFGTTGPVVDAVAGQDLSAYLDGILALDPDADPGAVATPLPSFATQTVPPPGSTEAVLEAYNDELRDQLVTLESWWLHRMAAVKEPIHEKLTLLWHNHFATSAEKVPIAGYMIAQNQKLRTLHLGDFRALAFAMLTDPAMLVWLDGVRNTKEAPNENLSREFMELFTLGHGDGYTEVDVREGARALTGRLVGKNGETAVSVEHHDDSPKTVLGTTADLDEGGFCDVVLAHPTSAPFVAGKLWKLLASDAPPSDATLGRLVGAYGPNRDLRALTKAVLMDPEFVALTGTMVNTPVEWVLGIIRTLAIPLDDPRMPLEFDALFKVLGQRPFFPPDVGGWPRGVVWLTTSSTAARVWAADRLVSLGNLSAIEDTPMVDRVDAAGYLIGVGKWSARTAAALTPLRSDPARLVAAAVNSPEYLTS